MQINFNDEYSEVYGQKYTDKMNHLVKSLVENKTSEDKFHVLNYEAGLGKSVTVDRVLKVLCKNHKTDFFDPLSLNSFLVVKPFNDESISSVNFIHNDKEAITINHTNWPYWRTQLKNLCNYKVIYISHQRYISLCEDDKLRSYFEDQRETLIIDEKINFPTYTYSKELLGNIVKIIPNSLTKSLFKVTKPLNKYLEERVTYNQTKECFKVRFKINQVILETFQNEMNTLLDNKTIKNLEHREQIKSFIKLINIIYEKVECTYNNKSITVANPKHKYWGLSNNIILDASAYIDGVYKVSQQLNVIHQSRIIDHSLSSFNIISFNSSKSNINQNKRKYFTEIAEKIINNREEEERVLIVTHKEFEKEIKKELLNYTTENDIYIDYKENTYNNQSIGITWYGNVIGKNWAREFEQVWLISTPNIPAEQYPLQYKIYSTNDIGNKSLSMIKGRYKNALFNTIQKGYIAAEMYQALKRIQRNPKPKGKFFIVNNDKEIVDMILSQMKNADDINNIELEFVKEALKEKEVKQQVDQVQQFIDYILKQNIGRYKKSDIAKELHITKLNRVLSDARIKPILNKHIRILNKEIVRV